MWKKIAALALAAVLMMTLAACGSTTASLPELVLETSTGEDGTTALRHKEPTGVYEDSLAGLFEYMKAGQALTLEDGVAAKEGGMTADEDISSFVQMSFKEIGALDGYRCQFKFNSSTVQVELYSFDPDDLDEKGQVCISSVKENGSFEVLGNEVKAVLHPSGKYLMIYTDQNAEKNDLNMAQQKWAEELFLGFQQ